MRKLQIGRQSAGFVSRGHPWIRPDRFTKGLDQLKQGEAVTLVDERGKGLASALVDPQAAICARVYHKLPNRDFDPAAAIARAWKRRADLHADERTTCYRVVHGEADYLPGLRVERYADVLVALIQNAALMPHLDGIIVGLQAVAPEHRLVIREQLDDLRKADTRCRFADGTRPDPDERVIGHESGVAVVVTPFADLATGIYVDQRGTRDWLADQVADKRVLNLFAYTGFFSSHALIHGAASTVDVDLSGPALGLASENAELNQVADRHRIAKADCIAWLKDCGEQFDIVVCDPPTAARGGGGWVGRRDYPKLLQALQSVLAPDALVICCSNTIHGKKFDLRRAVTEHLPDLNILSQGPRLGIDLPSLKGFPESRPYQLVTGTY